VENSIFFNFYALFIVALGIIGLGLYAILSYRNLIKIFIGIEVMSKGIGLLFIAAGSANGRLALAQSYLITYIVIEAVVATVALSLIMLTYRHYGTLDIRKLSKLKG